MKQNEKLRIEFNFLFNGCNCSRWSLEGYCTPYKCFPRLLKLLYPTGGFQDRYDKEKHDEYIERLRQYIKEGELEEMFKNSLREALIRKKKYG